MLYSIIIPVYKNAEFIPLLVSEFTRVAAAIEERFAIATEFVFVVDGSPDESYSLLATALETAPLRSQLILHVRNFGSFAAIRTGLQAANGDFVGVIAADLQEPPELLISFLEPLASGAYDVVIGVREGREDPTVSRAFAGLFWALYRTLVMKEIPAGGVDLFACSRRVRDELLNLNEANSSLVGQVFWLGFRRTEIRYHRRARAFGRSAWTFKKKLDYLMDSVFAFTDLPIRLLTFVGLLGTTIAILLGFTIIALRMIGGIDVPGYAATVTIISFFGALNMLGLGLVGSYAWRAYENTKRRPLSIVQSVRTFQPDTPTSVGLTLLLHRVAEHQHQ